MKNRSLILLLTLALSAASAQSAPTGSAVSTDARLSKATVTFKIVRDGTGLMALLTAIAKSAGYELILDPALDSLITPGVGTGSGAVSSDTATRPGPPTRRVLDPAHLRLRRQAVQSGLALLDGRLRPELRGRQARLQRGAAGRQEPDPAHFAAAQDARRRESRGARQAGLRHAPDDCPDAATLQQRQSSDQSWRHVNASHRQRHRARFAHLENRRRTHLQQPHRARQQPGSGAGRSAGQPDRRLAAAGTGKNGGARSVRSSSSSIPSRARRPTPPRCSRTSIRPSPSRPSGRPGNWSSAARRPRSTPRWPCSVRSTNPCRCR